MDKETHTEECSANDKNANGRCSCIYFNRNHPMTESSSSTFEVPAELLTTTNPSTDWREEFDEDFGGVIDVDSDHKGSMGFLLGEIKHFIESLLSRKEEEVRKELSKTVEEAIRDTQTKEDLTARLFSIIVSTIAEKPII